MNRKKGWFAALLVLTLLAVACGPTMTTPTPATISDATEAPTTAPSADTPTAPPAGTPTEAAAPAQTPTAEAVSPGDLPVSPDDWHVLGSADAKVTIIEYSDFQ